MIAINCMSSKDNDEERGMHSKCDETKIIINNEGDELIEEVFNHFFQVSNLA